MADIIRVGAPKAVVITADGSHKKNIPEGGGLYRIPVRPPDQPQRDPSNKRKTIDE